MKFLRLLRKEDIKGLPNCELGHEKRRCTCFTFYTIHSAPSCVLAEDRKALSLRVVGDDTTFDSRVKNPAPPFTQMGYKANHGDLIKESWFPRYG